MIDAIDLLAAITVIDIIAAKALETINTSNSEYTINFEVVQAK